MTHISLVVDTTSAMVRSVVYRWRRKYLVDSSCPGGITQAISVA